MSYDPPSDQGWDRPPGPGPEGAFPPPPPPPDYGPPSGGYGGPPPPYPPPPSGYPYPPPAYPGYQGGYPGYQGGYPAPVRTDGTAIAALILSIASFVICPVIPAIIALVLIPGSRATIRAAGGAVEGESLLTAAKIISLIHLGLVVLAVLAGALLIAVSASSSAVRLPVRG
jgi:hypothetical protein